MSVNSSKKLQPFKTVYSYHQHVFKTLMKVRFLIWFNRSYITICIASIETVSAETSTVSDTAKGNMGERFLLYKEIFNRLDYSLQGFWNATDTILKF